VVPLVAAHVLDRLGKHYAGVGEDEIDTAHHVGDLLGDDVDGRGVGDVEGERVGGAARV
jgi:hypothetical protein